MSNQFTSLKKWVTKAGLPAEVAFYIGWHCGYVQVPVGSCLDGLNYWDNTDQRFKLLQDVSVHGGITYSGRHKNGQWAFGFDINRYRDSVFEQDQIYMEDQCEKLALQLKSIIDKKETKETQ